MFLLAVELVFETVSLKSTSTLVDRKLKIKGIVLIVLNLKHRSQLLELDWNDVDFIFKDTEDPKLYRNHCLSLIHIRYFDSMETLAAILTSSFEYEYGILDDISKNEPLCGRLMAILTLQQKTKWIF